MTEETSAKPDETIAPIAPSAPAGASARPAAEPKPGTVPPPAGAKAAPEPSPAATAPDPATKADAEERATRAREAEIAAAKAAALAAENADLKDRALRVAAEMENLRRRTEREIVDARQYAISAFARELLAVGDNLSRALGAVPGEARQADGPFATLLAGVEMTDRELHRVLEKHGVRRFSPAGEKFDPHRHQAIYEVESAAAAGIVVDVIQAGYAIGERVLRPALVAVAKAMKAAPAAAAAATESAFPNSSAQDG